jgi:hypothetical protein
MILHQQNRKRIIDWLRGHHGERFPQFPMKATPFRHPEARRVVE